MSKEKEKKNYFFCLKKTREECEEDMFGRPACEYCKHNSNCNSCGRANTSFCNRCENGGNKDA